MCDHSRRLQDLQEVSSKFAVSSIQLRFTFMRGLHPFYSPRLEVVRPHLANPLPGALASYPLLRLEHWDPTLTMKELLDNIRTFLEVRRWHTAHDGCGLRRFEQGCKTSDRVCLKSITCFECIHSHWFGTATRTEELVAVTHVPQSWMHHGQILTLRTPTIAPSPPNMHTNHTQEHGRIDVSDPRNSAAQFPSSAFSPVQVALTRLEAMTDVRPACYSRCKTVYKGRSTQGRWVWAAGWGQEPWLKGG
jgi:hypothetical protein